MVSKLTASLQATKRIKDKHSTLRKLREEGQIPAILNGESLSNPISVDSIEFIKTIRETGRNGVIQLLLDNEKHSVMLQELQTEPIKNEIIHADFKIVNMSTE